MFLLLLYVWFSLLQFCIGLRSLEVSAQLKYDKWVDKSKAPAINYSLKLYQEFLVLCNEKKRRITIENMINTRFQGCDKLILR